MFNKAILMGRICHDLELRTTPTNVPVLTFRIAVDRSYQTKGEERKADFFNVVAWRSTAEFVNRYFGKGRMILVEGELQTRQYTDKNGSTQTVVELVASNVSFTGEAKQGSSNYSGNSYGGNNNSYGNSNSGGNYGTYQNQPSAAQEPVLSNGSNEDFSQSGADDDDDYPF